MKFNIITIFPQIFDSYCDESIIKCAREKGLIKVAIHNLRDFTSDKHHRVDDKPYGGGTGMVLQIQPIVRAVEFAKSKIKNKKSKILITSARGKQFTQGMAREWANKYDELIIICGHYEGVDERVKQALKYEAQSMKQGIDIEEISVGPYILTGGELPAMVIVDAVSRHIPGVLGKRESLEEIKGSYPVFTRPEIFEWKMKKYHVPKVLLTGNHKKIAEWRSKKSKISASGRIRLWRKNENLKS